MHHQAFEKCHKNMCEEISIKHFKTKFRALSVERLVTDDKGFRLFRLFLGPKELLFSSSFVNQDGGSLAIATIGNARKIRVVVFG